MKKLITSLLISLLIAVTCQSYAFAYDTAVNDEAGLFSAEEVQSIQAAAENFALETTYSFAVVTTDDAQGKTSEEYADDSYDDLIFNSGWSENGILFLIDMDNRNVQISTAGDCILVFDDSTIESIIDSGYDSLADGYYADCILEMTDAALTSANSYVGDNYYVLDEDDYSYGDPSFAGEIVEYDGEYYKVTPEGEWQIIENPNADKGIGIFDVIISILGSAVIAAIIVFVIKGKYKNMGKGDEFDSDDVMLNLTGSDDRVTSHNVITTVIPKNDHKDDDGPNFSGGGSSIHVSGGGISHGGGGRGF